MPAVFGSGPTVIGHRGLGSGVVDGHRQNTMESFTAAVRSGARWVEADVRRLGDDTLVVAHDACPTPTAPVWPTSRTTRPSAAARCLSGPCSTSCRPTSA